MVAQSEHICRSLQVSRARYNLGPASPRYRFTDEATNHVLKLKLDLRAYVDFYDSPLKASAPHRYRGSAQNGGSLAEMVMCGC